MVYKLTYSHQFSNVSIGLEDILLIEKCINNYYSFCKTQYDEIFMNSLFLINFDNDDAKTYNSLDELRKSKEIDLEKISSMYIYYSLNDLGYFKFVIDNNGNIEADFKGRYDQFITCRNEICKIFITKQKHSNFVSLLLNDNKIYIVINVMLFILFLGFFYNSVSSYSNYRTAKEIGVNISDNIIPKNNEIYSLIDKALKSNDINEKLNLLLQYNLRGFINADLFIKNKLAEIRKNIVLSFSMIILAFIFYKLRKSYSINILIGYNAKEQQRFEKWRYFWIITVLLTILLSVFSNIIFLNIS